MIDPAMQKDTDENFKDQDVGNPVEPCGTQTKNRYHVRVVEMDKKGYEAVLTKAQSQSSTHDVYKIVHKATRSEIIQEMKDSEAGDIFTSDTHTYIPKDPPHTPRVAVGIYGYNWHMAGENTDKDQVIWLAEMCSALTTGSAPAAAVIIGCRSADLLKGLIVMGAAKVALGIESPAFDVNSVKATMAAMEITAALMRGETILQAAAAGTAQVVGDGHTVQCELATGVQAGLSLSGNKLV